MKNTAATSTYLDLSYTYNRGNSYGSNTGSEKTGQLTKIVDNLDHNRDRLYEFDSLGRLRNAKAGTSAGASSVTANWVQSYTYDRYGNKTGVSATGHDLNNVTMPTDGISSVSADSATNRLNISTWTYDLTGNLIRGQDANGVWQKFEYDANGRLKKVINDTTSAVIETYTYGAGRERLINETSSQRTYYVWGGQSVTAEYTEATASSTPAYTKSYVYAGSRLLMTATKASSTSETQEFHHPDRLGTQVVTNGGTGAWYRQLTMPFGTESSAESSGNSNQVFTTYDRSSNTSLDYAVNRTYSKGQSRFTQVDPIGMSATSLGNPQSSNLFAYAQNMPTDFTDPSGLLKVELCTRYWVDFGDGNGRHYSGWNCVTIYDDGGGGGGEVPIPAPDKLRNMIVSRLDANNGKCRKFLDAFRRKARIGDSVENMFDKLIKNGGGVVLAKDISAGGVSSYGKGGKYIGIRPVFDNSERYVNSVIHELIHRAGIEGHQKFASNAFASLDENDQGTHPLPTEKGLGNQDMDDAFSQYFSKLMNEFCRPNI